MRHNLDVNFANEVVKLKAEVDLKNWLKDYSKRLDNEVISAIEIASDNTKGPQSGYWDKVYKILDELRNKIYN